MIDLASALVDQTVKMPAYSSGDPGSKGNPGQGDSLEKEMASHSSSLAWKILWMEKPGRLQSMGSQRVRYDRVTSLSLKWTKTLPHI